MCLKKSKEFGWELGNPVLYWFLWDDEFTDDKFTSRWINHENFTSTP